MTFRASWIAPEDSIMVDWKVVLDAKEATGDDWMTDNKIESYSHLLYPSD
jgi:hypothetical protein